MTSESKLTWATAVARCSRLAAMTATLEPEKNHIVEGEGIFLCQKTLSESSSPDSMNGAPDADACASR